MPSSLTDRQHRFVEEYMIDLNGTQAAIRAGYSSSPNSAKVTASRLLTYANVQSRINKLKSEKTIELKRTAEAVIEELWHIAGFNLLDALDDTGGAGLRFKPLDELEPHHAAAIRDARVVDGVIQELKPYDKLVALDKLCRHFGILGNPISYADCLENAEQMDPSAVTQEQMTELEEFLLGATL